MAERYTHVPRTILWLVRGDAGIEPFYIGKAPITNEQYEAYAPDYRRAPVSPGDRDAAVGVTLDEARGYADWYARVSKKTMRLPTEAEWELACRGGTTSRWFFGDDPAAGDPYLWDARNSEGRLGRWDALKPNPAGLHAMLGGVWEWTAEGTLRGGSFRGDREDWDCGTSRAVDPGHRADDVGFRIVRPFRVE